MISLLYVSNQVEIKRGNNIRYTLRRKIEFIDNLTKDEFEKITFIFCIDACCAKCNRI